MNGAVCGYTLLHRTALARPYTDVSSATCKFSEEKHGKSIDLYADLGKKGSHFSVSGNGKEYMINICGEVSECCKSPPCGKKSNCINDAAKTNLGSFYESFYQSEIFSVVYRDGDECPGGKGKKYDSIINIECAEEDEDGPSLAETSADGCSLTFAWRKRAACIEKVETSCGMIPTGYDLSQIQRRPHTLGEKFADKLKVRV